MRLVAVERVFVAHGPHQITGEQALGGVAAVGVARGQHKGGHQGLRVIGAALRRLDHLEHFAGLLLRDVRHAGLPFGQVAVSLAHRREVAAHRRQRRGDFVRQKTQGLAQGGRAALDQRLLARAAHAGGQRLAQHLTRQGLVQRLLQDRLHMSLVDRGHGHVLVGIGRHQQPRHVGEALPHLAEQGHAVAYRHGVVGEQHGNLMPTLLQQGQRFVHTAGREDGELVAVHARKPLAGLRLVVHHQDGVRAHRCGRITCGVGIHAGGLGKSKTNSVQAPGSLSTIRVPPCRCTMP
ncbi:hypothetical protein FQZ97_862940 [compost metagenome]